MKAAGIALFLFCASNLAGRAAFRVARLRPSDDPATAAILETALGLWLLSLLIFFLGVAQAFTAGAIWVALGAAVPLCIMITRIPDRRASHERMSVAPDTGQKSAGGHIPPPVFWCAFATAAAISILRGFEPPTDFDPLVYHLTLPKQYLMRGGIAYLPTILYASFPQTMEMLFTPGVSLNAPNAAHFLHTGIGLLTAALLYAWLRRAFHTGVALAAAAAFYFTPLVGIESPTALIDLAPAFFILCGVVMIAGARPGDVKTAAMGMVFAGVAVSCKWTAAPVAAMLLVWAAMSARIARPGAIVALAAAALIPAAPYLLKNFALTGDPLWPLFAGIFPSRDLPPDIAHRVISHVRGTGEYAMSMARILRLPWNISMDAMFKEGAFTSIFVCFLPLYLIVKKDRTVSALILIGLLFLPIWFYFLNPSSRFVLPVLPLWAVAAGYVYHRIEGRAARAAATAALLLHIVLGLATISFGDTGLISNLPFLLGRESREAFLEARGPEYRLHSAVNALARPGDRALLGEASVRGFYLDMPVYFSNPYFQGHYQYENMRSPGEMYDAFRKDGITLVIFDRYGPVACKGDMELLDMLNTLRLWRGFIENYTDVVYTTRHGTVLRLTPRAKPEPGCGRKNAELRKSKP